MCLVLESLAQRHKERGVHPAHCVEVGEICVESLLECLGEEVFTEECKQAWIHLYSFILDIVFKYLRNLRH